MALSAGLIWEVRSTASDTNGGGNFSTGANVDRSLQDSPQVIIDNVTVTATCNGTTITFTGGTYTVLASDIGNVVNMISGVSLTVKRYQIASVGAGLNGTWVLDSTTGMLGTAITSAKMGGALASPGFLNTTSIINLIDGQFVYLFNAGATVFSITTNVVGTAGVITPGNITLTFIGYATNRIWNNTDTPPTIQSNTATTTQVNAVRSGFFNITFDGNTQASAKLTSNGLFVGCTFKNFTVATSGNTTFVGCLATTNSAAVLFNIVVYCEAYANTATPITAVLLMSTLSYSNTGASTDGAAITTLVPVFIDKFTSVANGRAGIVSAISGNKLIQNSVFQSNINTGISAIAGANTFSRTNGFFGNSADTGGAAPNLSVTGSIDYSADAFSNLVGNVYSLNTLATQGAALRALALPALFPRGLTPSYSDLGAAQHQDIPPFGFIGSPLNRPL